MTFSRGARAAHAVAIIFSLTGLMCLAACGGGGGPVTLIGASVTIQLTPTFPGSTTSLGPGASANIQATVFDPNNKGVTWSFSPPTFGALSDPTSTSVTYTAPASFPAATTVTILATSITNPNVIRSIQIPTSPITVSLAVPGISTPLIPLSDQTINQGGTLDIQALIANGGVFPVLTWTLAPPTGAGSLSPSGGGSLVNTTSTFVTYAAPATVSSPTTVTVTATSADSDVSASFRITVFPSGGGSNVAVISVNGGPVPGQVYKNGAFINGVTICNPGQPPAGAFPFPVCQTVNGILVDTGSYGLRILQSAIPSLKLPSLTNADGNILENCYAFPDGSYLWGPAATADVYVGGLNASSFINGPSAAVPVQVISSRINGGVPDSCSNGGANLNTPEQLGANGILGVGPEPTDCTLAGVNFCDGSAQAVPPNVYYACPTSGCLPADSPVLANRLQQVTNPARAFNANGVVINLPAVSGAESSVNGTLTFGFFGVAPGATIYTLDANANFTTVFNGQNLTRSFIDSGSNALFFPDSVPVCDDNTQFFCPPALTNLSASNQGATQGENVIDFAVDNADNLFSTNPGFAAFSTLAGPSGTGSCASGAGACTFDWGLPFFYGRTVYTKIDTCSPDICSPLFAGWWAY